jgi:hypothetical protein
MVSMKTVILFSILVISLLVGLSVSAQGTTHPEDMTPDHTLTTIVEALQPTIEAARTMIRVQMTAQAEYSLFDFRIVYLIPQTTADHYTHVLPATGQQLSLLAPGVIHDTSGAIIVHTWQEVLDLHDEQSIHALMIHADAESLIDTTWLRDAYRTQEVIIVGFNFNNTWLRDTLGTHRLHTNTPILFEGDFMQLHSKYRYHCGVSSHDGSVFSQDALNTYEQLFLFNHQLKRHLYDAHYPPCS